MMQLSRYPWLTAHWPLPGERESVQSWTARLPAPPDVRLCLSPALGKALRNWARALDPRPWNWLAYALLPKSPESWHDFGPTTAHRLWIVLRALHVDPLWEPEDAD